MHAFPFNASHAMLCRRDRVCHICTAVFNHSRLMLIAGGCTGLPLPQLASAAGWERESLPYASGWPTACSTPGEGTATPLSAQSTFCSPEQAQKALRQFQQGRRRQP